MLLFFSVSEGVNFLSNTVFSRLALFKSFEMFSFEYSFSSFHGNLGGIVMFEYEISNLCKFGNFFSRTDIVRRSIGIPCINIVLTEVYEWGQLTRNVRLCCT